MMDGRVGAIRAALEAAGHQDVMIMSYAPNMPRPSMALPRGDRLGKLGGGSSRTGRQAHLQMDPGNTDESLREVALDIAEAPTW